MIKFKQKNEFILRGRIVNKNYNDVACNITLRLLRNDVFPNQVDTDRLFNYPDVAFYRNKDDANKFNNGDIVEIKGTIQSQRSKDEFSNFNVQKLVGFEIKQASRTFDDFGDDFGPFENDENIVKLGGIVSSVRQIKDRVAVINIRTFVDEKENNVQTFIYRNLEENEFNVGDIVVAFGNIQTIRKDYDGEIRHFRNIVLKAIKKVS